jgi:hypothetical protein
LGRLTGHPTRSHASVELAYGAFRLLAAFLGLLAEPGSIVGHADQIGGARNDYQRIRVMVAEG